MVEYGHQSLFRGVLMIKRLHDVEFETRTIGLWCSPLRL